MMVEVLQQINTVPGVVGSLVCGDDGEVLAQAFPPLFDVSIIRDVSSAVADPGAGIRSAAGAFDLVDLRYSDGRIVVKPLADAYLLLLCTKAVNLQVLTISLNVAKGKLESQLQSRASEGIAPAVAAGGDAVLALPACHIDDATIGGSFEQFGMAAVTQTTARQISGFYQSGPVKKLRLTNRTGGASGVFGVMVVNENDASYDGNIILCKAIERKLQTAPGDILSVELP